MLLISSNCSQTKGFSIFGTGKRNSLNIVLLSFSLSSSRYWKCVCFQPKVLYLERLEGTSVQSSSKTKQVPELEKTLINFHCFSAILVLTTSLLISTTKTATSQNSTHPLVTYHRRPLTKSVLDFKEDLKRFDLLSKDG